MESVTARSTHDRGRLIEVYGTDDALAAHGLRLRNAIVNQQESKPLFEIS